MSISEVTSAAMPGDVVRAARLLHDVMRADRAEVDDVVPNAGTRNLAVRRVNQRDDERAHRVLSRGCQAAFLAGKI